MIHTGCVYFYEIDGQKIINFPTKFHFKYPSQIEWIEQGLKYFLANYKKWNIKSIAFPILGASNGGLNSQAVEELMIKYLSSLDIDVYICYSKLLEGKELSMLKAFKDSSIFEISKQVRLTTKQMNELESNQGKIQRFADIYNIKGIGIGTYKALFELFYSEKPIQEKQISLF